MKHIDTEQLKALAQAATPGPWLYYEHGVGEHAVFRQTEADESAICFADDDIRYATLDMRQQGLDLAFIAAANPAAILGLIEAIEQLRAQRDEFARILRNLIRACEDSFDWQYEPKFNEAYERACEMSGAIAKAQEVQP